nr:Ldh family oxidoreductase [Bacillus subtilis]
MVDVFSGLLAGAAFGTSYCQNVQRYFDQKRKLGHYVCAINPAFFTDWDTFLEQMDAMIDELRQSPPAVGFERVYVPGEIEQIA